MADEAPVHLLRRQRRALFLVFLLVGQELPKPALGAPSDGIPPELVDSTEGSITLRVEAPSSAAVCQVFRDSGGGSQPLVPVYDGPCDAEFTVTGLEVDRNYQFQSRGIDANGQEGARGEIVTYISAGTPDWQGVIPVLEKVGADSVKLSWRPPASGGSPVLGYHVDMEANSDGNWERVYDGTNQPSILTFQATGLHASLTYSFRLYAENRIGFGTPAEVTMRISNIMASQEARATTMNTALSADQEYTVFLRSVEPDAMDGLYKTEYLLQQAGPYNLIVKLAGTHIQGSPFAFFARPGRVSPAHSTTEGDGTISFVAGFESQFTVQARDAYGNALDEDAGSITVSIEWENYVATTPMIVSDDSMINTAEFGRYFYGEAVYEGGETGRYHVKYVALREGAHKLFVKVNGENVHGSPYALHGYPAEAPYGPKSLCEATKPAPTATAGVEVVFQVQLRDAYGNLLGANPPEGTLTISVGAPPPTTARDVGTCTAVAGSAGLYDCRVTPTTSGDRLMSVQVSDVEVSTLVVVQPLSRVTVSRGPFQVYVEPADVSPPQTTVYGLPDYYMAGTAVPSIVQLRDRFGNNRTRSKPFLNFQARFGPSLLTFLDHDNGTVTVWIGTHLAGYHQVEVMLDGNQIGNTPSVPMQVRPTAAHFGGTLCAIPPEVIAGVELVYQCTRATYTRTT